MNGVEQIVCEDRMRLLTDSIIEFLPSRVAGELTSDVCDASVCAARRWLEGSVPALDDMTTEIVRDIATRLDVPEVRAKVVHIAEEIVDARLSRSRFERNGKRVRSGWGGDDRIGRLDAKAMDVDSVRHAVAELVAKEVTAVRWEIAHTVGDRLGDEIVESCLSRLYALGPVVLMTWSLPAMKFWPNQALMRSWLELVRVPRHVRSLLLAGSAIHTIVVGGEPVIRDEISRAVGSYYVKQREEIEGFVVKCCRSANENRRTE